MIKVTKLTCTANGRLLSFNSQPLPDDFKTYDEAEAAILYTNEKEIPIMHWDMSEEITLPDECATYLFMDPHDRDGRVSVWVASGREHTDMLTQEGGEAAYDCQKCGRGIRIDCVLEPDLWAKISPTGDDGGILCASCMADNLATATDWPAIAMVNRHDTKVFPPITPVDVTREEAQRIREAGPGGILPQQIERVSAVFVKALDWAAGNDVSVMTEMSLSGNESRVMAVDGAYVNKRLGSWLSAALEDPSVCAEMKEDIKAWFAYLDAVKGEQA